ncbi:hypothetical protein S40285_08776 [Stachybotrys chlorohalonatus IBT 40285]|uniref:Enoyl reductase (ER) domain-containing protein n=1 Tax=Stachybotrys chlorohalonatus (strain IBT 40285) TaxID=1283841 RepID=A0A084QV75_STAC4|nr:hypothetical protein S40285_08776 [Stachybotrys chlorohalonata IBT 40285]
MPASKAIFLGADGHLALEDVTDHYSPTGAQALVKVRYSAVNPADIRHSYMNLYGSVAGYEFVGEVLEVGPDSRFTKGQVVFGQSMPGYQRPKYLGAHQDYLLAEDLSTYVLPNGLKDVEAVTLPTAALTAIDAISNILGFGLPAMGIDGLDATDRSILIWGGGSIVGFYAIQLAKLAGFRHIFATASSHNHEALLAVGATQVFDYREPAVVKNIQKAVKASGALLTVAFDAVAAGQGIFEPVSDVKVDLSKSTPQIALQCLMERESEPLRLAAVLPVIGDERWKMVLACRPLGDSAFGTLQDPAWPLRSQKAIQWLIDNHDKALKFPPREMVKGGKEGLQALRRVFAGKVSLKKVVIEHPM